MLVTKGKCYYFCHLDVTSGIPDVAEYGPLVPKEYTCVSPNGMPLEELAIEPNIHIEVLCRHIVRFYATGSFEKHEYLKSIPGFSDRKVSDLGYVYSSTHPGDIILTMIGPTKGFLLVFMSSLSESGIGDSSSVVLPLNSMRLSSEYGFVQSAACLRVVVGAEKPVWVLRVPFMLTNNPNSIPSRLISLAENCRRKNI